MDSVDEVVDSIGYAKVLVSLKPAATAAASSSALTEALSEFFSCEDGGQASSLRGASRQGADVTSSTAQPAPTVKVYPLLGLAIGTVAKFDVERLRADNRVNKIEIAPELSLIRPVAATAAKRPTTTTWGIERLNVPAAWAAGFTGAGVIVGHLDTGFDASHPALNGALHSFAEFDRTGEIIPGAPPRDSDEHGTHTAGTIAGRPTGRGRIGVAPGCTVASAMVIEGGDVINRILGGLEWIVSQGATVLSMSLGLRGYTPAFQSVINALLANDVLPVIAVGNEYANSSRSPGNYANVLSVGAMGADERVADFSGSQRFSRVLDPLVPDLVAPGVAVLSCVPGQKYAELDGSSMATPHIAGLAAILRQAAPTASATDVAAVIQASCVRPGSMSEDRANRGVPDVMKALAGLKVVVPLAAAQSSKAARKSRITNKSNSNLEPAAAEAISKGSKADRRTGGVKAPDWRSRAGRSAGRAKV